MQFESFLFKGNNKYSVKTLYEEETFIIFKGPPEFMTCNFYGSTSQYVKLNILLSNYLSNFLALWILFTGRTLDWLHVVLL